MEQDSCQVAGISTKITSTHHNREPTYNSYKRKETEGTRYNRQLKRASRQGCLIIIQAQRHGLALLQCVVYLAMQVRFNIDPNA